MNVFEKNITNAFGDRGSAWLQSLPAIIKKLAKHWSLDSIQPVKNMSWNYVAYAEQNHIDQVILKISCDQKVMQDELRALKHFNGHGAIKVIDAFPDDNAMLLERAIPGSLLKEQHSLNMEDTIKIYADVVHAIASQPLYNGVYTHVSDWCKAIDNIQDARISAHLMSKAAQLKSTLLHSVKREYLCHGDLHLENIIQHGSNWLSIDPKGIIGEMAFEAAAFDLLDQNEMKDASTISIKVIERVNQLSKRLDIEFDRLMSWVYLRIMLSAQWFIEDNGDPSHMINLAQHVYPLLK